MFIGRKDELQVLERSYSSIASGFCVIYGRRRIGKTTLIERFVTDKPTFFYSAGHESKRLQLKRFVQELGEAIQDPLTGKVAVTEWNEALELLDRSLSNLSDNGKKAIVVLDEFQWMCNGATELISDLQRFWDRIWKASKNIFLIICGSAVSFILGEVLSRKSPLFGRRTLSFELGPFQLSDASLFLPRRSRFEIAEAYMMVGGVPKYLEILNNGTSIRDTTCNQSFNPTGYLFDEIRFILSEQLKETEHYFMLLSQMATGAQGVTELGLATGIPSGQIMFYIERLLMLGFVSRHTPLGAQPNTKKVRYRLDDYYLRFYFSFIHPNAKRVSAHSSAISFSYETGNRWSNYAGIAFEHLARDHADRIVKKLGRKSRISRIGSYWQKPTKRKKGVQIDLLIECQDETTLICECKWSRSKTGMEAVSTIRNKSSLYPNLKKHTLHHVLIASADVTKTVRKQKDIAIATLDDFF